MKVKRIQPQSIEYELKLLTITELSSIEKQFKSCLINQDFLLTKQGCYCKPVKKPRNYQT